MPINGFPNTGNTCYINSALVTLFASFTFIKWLQTVEEGSTGLTQYLWLLSRHFNGKKMEDVSLVYRSFIDAVHRNPKFTMEQGGQNDAQEFLIQLLDAVSEENRIVVAARSNSILQLPGNNSACKSVGKSTGQKRLAHRMDDAWFRTVGPYGVLGNMLHGQLVHQVRCGGCNSLSHTAEPFMCLSLDMPLSKGQVHLSDCFEHTFKDDIIQEAWVCEKCNRTASAEIPATKSVRLWRLPSVMVITVKRFLDNGHKCVVPIAFESDLMGCLEHASCKASPYYRDIATARFDYKASIHHHGHASFGHYVAMYRDIKSAKGKEHDAYIVVDDEQVHPVSPDSAVSFHKSTYVLIYERR